MSVLFVATMPASGHVNPLLPVLSRLAASGTKVVAAGTEEFAERISATGADFVPYPPGVLESADIAEATQSGSSVAVIVRVLKATETFAPFVAEEARRVSASAILHDSNALWGRIGARLADLPTVSFMTTILIGTGAIKALSLRESMAETWPTMRSLPAAVSGRREVVRMFGKDLVPPTPMLPLRGDLTLFPVPRDLQGPDDRLDDTCVFVGPTAEAGTPAALDDVLRTFIDGTEPVVLVSLGTLHAAGEEFFETCAAAFGELPVRVVLATGRSELETPLPANMLAMPRVPQTDLLARTGVFVTHGGMNSALEGIAAGVPLVVVPQQVEQFLIGQAFAEQGAALVLRENLSGRPVPADELRVAVRTALDDPGFREAATALGERMRAEGGADRAAALIGAFLSERG
ncbi:MULTISPECIES: nucleotide disphospho-sugar-binding domain-containing protein [unclassified Microbacterium]|uniref:nucleotide disphospho-sugar-binding domain-containing protein n=1 Tax=unclassified Microbacterium TaxID=2609290 RepID=UPI0012FAF15E|nr:nucleotide disphospho-sugar-binding domain-containing protein [Microbacterium sp. MAH-37]MVQ42076.1 glycosyl transferase [Microbacterium sp. MAH-37]